MAGLGAAERAAMVAEIDWLIQRKESEPLREAPDWRRLGLPEQSAAPGLCFQRVRDRLHAGDYASLAEFREEIRCVFAAAFAYHPDYCKAHRLARKLEEGWRRLCEGRRPSAEERWLRAVTPEQWAWAVQHLETENPRAITRREGSLTLELSPELAEALRRPAAPTQGL